MSFAGPSQSLSSDQELGVRELIVLFIPLLYTSTRPVALWTPLCDADKHDAVIK